MATTRGLRALDRHPREVSINDASARRGPVSSSASAATPSPPDARVAFGKTVPSDDPRIVTFAGKHSFDAFSRSLASDALDRSSRAYDHRRPGPGPPPPPPRPPPPARPPPVVQSTRDLACAPVRDDRTPLEAYEAAREAARLAAVRPPMDLVPAHIPLAQYMRNDAVRDRGPNYPRGPFSEFKWVFSRDPGPDDAALPEFYRHHRRLRPGPAHANEFLGDAVDARLLVVAERDAAAAEAAKAATSSGVRWAREKKQSALRLAHRPGHLAPAYPAGQARSAERQMASPSSFRGVGGGATFAGATTDGGGFWVPGDAANGLATRRVKTCSAYATRLIERGRVGGMVNRERARGGDGEASAGRVARRGRQRHHVEVCHGTLTHQSGERGRGGAAEAQRRAGETEKGGVVSKIQREGVGDCLVMIMLPGVYYSANTRLSRRGDSHAKDLRKSAATTRPLLLTESFCSLISRSTSSRSCTMKSTSLGLSMSSTCSWVTRKETS
jgi:hypothetical protein